MEVLPLACFDDHLLVGRPAAPVQNRLPDPQLRHEPLTILAIGPLTNLGTLLRESPECADRIERIYIMGGAVYVPGNITGLIPESDNKVAEWNIHADPLAFEAWALSDLLVNQVSPPK